MELNEFIKLAVNELHTNTSNYIPTYNLLKVCRMNKFYYFGYFVGKLLEKVDDERFLDELALCAYYIGYYNEAYNLNKRILTICSDKIMERIKQNTMFCEQKMARVDK